MNIGDIMELGNKADIDRPYNNAMKVLMKRLESKQWLSKK